MPDTGTTTTDKEINKEEAGPFLRLHSMHDGNLLVGLPRKKSPTLRFVYRKCSNKKEEEKPDCDVVTTKHHPK